MAFTKRFEDDFNKTGPDVDLSAWTPSTLGLSWTQGAGATEAQVDSSTDTVVMPYYTGAVIRIYTADISGSWADDQKATGVDTVSATIGSSSRSPGVRVSAGDDGYFAGDFGAYTIKAHRVDNGALTEIKNHAVTNASTDRIGLYFTGATGQLEKNGSDIGTSFTDSTFTTGSVGCLFSDSYTANGIDNFEGSDEGGGAAGRIMSSLAGAGGLAGVGGIAGHGGGLAG